MTDDGYHKPICVEQRSQCNPATEPRCLCWWESDDPQDFNKRATLRMKASGRIVLKRLNHDLAR